MQITTIRWLCYAIGYVFITSGIIKLINHDFQIMFANYGLPYPEMTVFLVAIAEIACGALICAHMYVKHAANLLIIIMVAAILISKLPLLANGTILDFLFDIRLNVVMLILLVIVQRNSKYS